MSWNRIKAILLQEFFITIHSVEIFFDIFIFSIISLLLFGFLSLYLAGTSKNTIAGFLLIGMLLWEIIRVTQYSISVGSLWNIWARNLSNMFISPLHISEHILAHTLSGIVKSLIVFFINATITMVVFHFNIFQLGIFNLFLLFINLILFSFSIGVLILGFIFKYGTRIQAFAWGFVPILQPLTAAFFPVKVLPFPLKELAYLFPTTYTFEAARYVLISHKMNWELIGFAMGINAIYLLLSALIFKLLFYQSRISGQFARNEA